MNSGGAHCLKYGVATNKVLGVRIVLMGGEVVDLGGNESMGSTSWASGSAPRASPASSPRRR